MKTSRNCRAIAIPFILVLIFLTGIIVAAAFLRTSYHLSRAGSEASPASSYRGISQEDILKILQQADERVQIAITSGEISYTDYGPAYINLTNIMLSNYLQKKGIVDMQLMVVESANLTVEPAIEGLQPVLSYGTYTVILRRL